MQSRDIHHAPLNDIFLLKNGLYLIINQTRRSTSMDAIVKSLSDVKMQVPRPILEAVYRNRVTRGARNLIGLDESIKQAVISTRVLVDCSLLGGDEMHIPMSSANITQIDDQTLKLYFPKSATNDRSILTVLGIEFSNPSSTAWLSPPVGADQSPLGLQIGKKMLDVHGPIPSTFSSRCVLTNENTVVITGFNAPPVNFYLRCILEYSERMSSLNPRYYYHFSKLVVWAVKAHIFNVYELEVAEAELSGGRELAKFGEIIGRYSDSNELYSEYLREKWQKLSFMNDQPSYHGLLRSMIRGV
jgi:hypothetical protein